MSLLKNEGVTRRFVFFRGPSRKKQTGAAGPAHFSTLPLSILASLLSGYLVATMVRLNASLGEKIGIVESAFVVHLVGTFFLLLFLFGPAHRDFLKNLKGAPRHLWVGGFLGVFIVLASNYCVPQLGLLLTLGLFVCANLFFSTCADHFGFFSLPKFSITKKRLLGLIIAITGVALVYGST